MACIAAIPLPFQDVEILWHVLVEQRWAARRNLPIIGTHVTAPVGIELGGTYNVGFICSGGHIAAIADWEGVRDDHPELDMQYLIVGTLSVEHAYIQLKATCLQFGYRVSEGPRVDGELPTMEYEPPDPRRQLPPKIVLPAGVT